MWLRAVDSKPSWMMREDAAQVSAWVNQIAAVSGVSSPTFHASSLYGDIYIGDAFDLPQQLVRHLWYVVTVDGVVCAKLTHEVIGNIVNKYVEYWEEIRRLHPMVLQPYQLAHRLLSVIDNNVFMVMTEHEKAGYAEAGFDLSGVLVCR